MRSAEDQIRDLTNALCTLYDNPRIREAATMLATNHVTEASKRAGRRALIAALECANAIKKLIDCKGS